MIRQITKPLQLSIANVRVESILIRLSHHLVRKLLRFLILGLRHRVAAELTKLCGVGIPVACGCEHDAMMRSEADYSSANLFISSSSDIASIAPSRFFASAASSCCLVSARVLAAAASAFSLLRCSMTCLTRSNRN